MATTIRVWEIVGDDLKPAERDSLAASHVEAELETWIAKNPELLGDKLLIIDRQRDIPGVGRLDLLGIDNSGTLVVVELKRDLSSREAVAQALDYASWLDSESPETIRAHAEQFLDGSLDDAFSAMFGQALPELSCQNHKILLVAARLDASAERIINYLSERHGVDFNAAFFAYSKLSDGKEVLARTMLVADDVRPQARQKKQPPPSVDSLLTMAAERNALPLVDACRKVGELWREYRGATYGGSFSYWATTASGNSRSVFGIIPGAKYAPPPGHLDVWIPVKNLSEITDVDAETIRKAFTELNLVRENWAIECWLRLTSIQDAHAVVALFKKWMSQAAGAAHA
jgi:hypothetical protein